MKVFFRELTILFRFAFVFFLAALIGAAAVAVVSKKSHSLEYQSSAVMEFLPSEKLGEVGDERFFETECQKMASQQVLETVADSLKLDVKWGMDQSMVLAVLEDSVSCERVEGTNLGRLEVNHADPDIAFQLANNIPRYYKIWRAQSQRDNLERKLNSLDTAIEDQKDRVEAKRKVLDTIVRITGTPYFEDNSIEEEAISRMMVGLKEEKIVELSTEFHDYTEAGRDYERTLGQLGQMKDGYFKDVSELIPAQHAIFASLNFIEEPKLPKKPLSFGVSLRAPFFKALSVTITLALAGLVLVLFVRSFSWGRYLSGLNFGAQPKKAFLPVDRQARIPIFRPFTKDH